jgi:hypothetical protein
LSLANLLIVKVSSILSRDRACMQQKWRALARAAAD